MHSETSLHLSVVLNPKRRTQRQKTEKQTTYREDFIQADNFYNIFIEMVEEKFIIDDLEYLDQLQLELVDHNLQDKNVYLICVDFNCEKILAKYPDRYTFKVIASPYTFLYRLQQWCPPNKHHFPLPDPSLGGYTLKYNGIKKPFIYLGGTTRGIRDDFLSKLDLDQFLYSYGVEGSGSIDPFKRPQNDKYHSIGPPLLPDDLEMNYHVPSGYNKYCLFELVIECIPDWGASLGENLYITEKSYKPFFSGNPQLIYGNPGTLEQLRRAGFRTFPEIFDESYDTIIDNEKRAKLIKQQIISIQQLTLDQQVNMYQSVMDTVRYNRKHFETLRILSSWKHTHPLLTIHDTILQEYPQSKILNKDDNDTNCGM